jgi:hypothetical protein
MTADVLRCLTYQQIRRIGEIIALPVFRRYVVELKTDGYRMEAWMRSTERPRFRYFFARKLLKTEPESHNFRLFLRLDQEVKRLLSRCRAYRSEVRQALEPISY